MNDQELLSAIENEEKAALGYFSSDLSMERERALEFYQGKLDIQASDGRSDVVSTDVRDTVDGMLPDLLDIFLSSDRIVEFEPHGPEDEGHAKQATETCNYVFYKQNNGALILYEWFKTALLEKNGVVRYWWEDSPLVTTETYNGLNEVELQNLVMQPNVEVVSVEPVQDANGTFYNLSVKVKSDQGKVCIKGVPPEEFLISSEHDSLSLQSAPFVAQRTKKTLSQLREMGIDVDPDELGSGGDNIVEFSPEWNARRRFEEERDFQNRVKPDASQRQYWTLDGFIRADYDGDGFAELRHFIKVGEKLVVNEEADQINFAAICPVIMPYRFYGLSIADLVYDIQRIKSVVWRQMLDSLYLSNVPRTAVMESMVNLDDLLVSRPGGVIRTKTLPAQALMPLETRFVGQQAFPMVEYLDSVKENRSGFTRYSQGLEGQSLNKTATGMSLLTTATAKRMKLIARMFAETGVKELFRGILHLLNKYNTKPMTIRLTNQYVPVDPRQWKTQWDVTVNVGLGTGDKTQELVNLQTVMTAQKEFRTAGMTHIVNDQNLYNAARRLQESCGFKTEGEFFTPPGPENQPAPPPPNPEEIKAQVEKYKVDKQAEVDIYIANKQAEIKAAELTVNSQLKAAELQAADRQVDKKLEADLTVKGVEIQHDRMKTEADLMNKAADRQMAQEEAGLPVVKEQINEAKEAIAEIEQNLMSAISEVAKTAGRPKKIKVLRDKNGDLIGGEVE